MGHLLRVGLGKPPILGGTPEKDTPFANKTGCGLVRLSLRRDGNRFSRRLRESSPLSLRVREYCGPSRAGESCLMTVGVIRLQHDPFELGMHPPGYRSPPGQQRPPSPATFAASHRSGRAGPARAVLVMGVSELGGQIAHQHLPGQAITRQPAADVLQLGTLPGQADG